MKSPPALAQFAPMSTAELSREILAGNADAFEEFYRRYAPRVYGFLMVLTNANDHLARDLLQAVMLRVARKFKPASNDDAHWAWLATIARNAVIDHARSEQRRRRREEAAPIPTATEPQPPSEELTDALEQALAELHPQDVALIREFYYNTQPQAAIAARHETTVKALQCRLARLRSRLKQILLLKLDDET